MGAIDYGRRRLLKGAAALGGASLLNGYLAMPAGAADVHTAKAKGADWYKVTRNAIDALGGMSRFVKKGQSVCILPNLGWSRTPEQGANTHPKVLRAIVDLCASAGAKSIDVYCNPCNDARVTYDKSGAAAALSGTKARLQYISSTGWLAVKEPRAKVMKSASVYRLSSEADVHINVPVLKHHGGAQLTMCMKNLMGAVKDRGVMHQDLTNSIPDAFLMIPSALYVLDATRIMKRGGPTGGDTRDVEIANVVFAGTRGVEIDALGCELFGVKPASVGHVAEAGRRGLGEIDTAKIKVKSV